MTTTKKRERMLERIHQHGRQLQVIFPNTANIDTMLLQRRLRRLELTGNGIATRRSNDPNYSTEDAKDDCRDLLNSVCKLLGIENGKRLTIIVDDDPRGYSLKIDADDVVRLNLQIHRDMGGYGILSPDMSEE